MEFGDRVLAPQGWFNRDFVEMRYFGRYEDMAVPAVIFRLVEIAAEHKNTQRGDAAQMSLRKLFSEDSAKHRMAIVFAEDMQRHKADLIHLVRQLAEKLKKKHQITRDDWTGFERMCVEGDFALTIGYFGNGLNLKSGIAEVFIHHKLGNLFILYTAYSPNNFLTLPCDHIDLKSTYYSQLQSLAGGTAICEDEMSKWPILSNCCKMNVAAEVFRSCLPACEPRTMPRTKKEKDLLCRKCNKQVQKFTAGECGCQFLCFTCVTKNYMSEHFDRCVGCSAPYSDYQLPYYHDIVLSSNPHLKPLLLELRHDKRVMIITPPKCGTCNAALLSTASERYCGNCKPRTVEKHHNRSSSTIGGRQSRQENGGNRATSPTFGALREEKKAPAFARMAESAFPASRPLPDTPKSGQYPSKPNLPFRPVARQTTEDDEPQVRTPHESSQRTCICKTCGSLIPVARQDIYCTASCQCTSCWLQTIFDFHKNSSCPYCHSSYDHQIITHFLNVYEKCHVCELVVKREEIEKKAGCTVCYHCVISYTKNRKLWKDKMVGVCAFCKNVEFDLNKREMDMIKTQRACCESEEQANFPLACGHRACRTHIKWLRQCHVCHEPIPNSNRQIH